MLKFCEPTVLGMYFPVGSPTDPLFYVKQLFSFFLKKEIKAEGGSTKMVARWIFQCLRNTFVRNIRSLWIRSCKGEHPRRVVLFIKLFSSNGFLMKCALDDPHWEPATLTTVKCKRRPWNGWICHWYVLIPGSWNFLRLGINDTVDYRIMRTKNKINRFSWV